MCCHPVEGHHRANEPEGCCHKHEHITPVQQDGLDPAPGWTAQEPIREGLGTAHTGFSFETLAGLLGFPGDVTIIGVTAYADAVGLTIAGPGLSGDVLPEFVEEDGKHYAIRRFIKET